MTTMRFAIATCFLLASACGSKPEIRACNRTGHDMVGLTYDRTDAGNLRAGACSDYVTPRGEVYRYTDVQFTIGADTFTIQPVDYVGETPLSNDAWSYEITIVDFGAHRAEVNAKRD